jgi:CRISPR-associated protein Csn2
VKLVHPDINYHIVFEENIVNVIVVENPKAFRGFIEELVKQCAGEDGSFILSECEEEIDISRYIELVIDCFNLDFNQKRILNKVYNYLKTLAMDEKNYLKTSEMQMTILQYLEELISSSEHPLVYAADIDIVSIFKSADLKIETNYDTLLEKLVDYINIVQEYCGISCIVFVNLKTYLTEEELTQLYTHASYKKIHIILFEGRLYNKIPEFEKTFILDEDLCEIY